MKVLIWSVLMICSIQSMAQEVVHNNKATTTFNNSLSPDGQTIYFTQVAADFTRITIMEGNISEGKVDSIKPVVIDGIELDGTDIHITPDGQYMLYSARTPFNSKNQEMADYNLYISQRKDDQWTHPKPLPEAINSSSDEFYPSLTSSGDIYFARRIKDSNLDVFVSRYVDGEYLEAERLGPEINSPILEGDPFIATSGDYLIFARMKPEGGLGMTDLFISYKTADGWTNAENLKDINSPGIDGSPFVSRDGNWLYLTSNREGENPEAFDASLGLYRIPMSEILEQG